MTELITLDSNLLGFIIHGPKSAIHETNSVRQEKCRLWKNLNINHILPRDFYHIVPVPRYNVSVKRFTLSAGKKPVR